MVLMKQKMMRQMKTFVMKSSLVSELGWRIPTDLALEMKEVTSQEVSREVSQSVSKPVMARLVSQLVSQSVSEPVMARHSRVWSRGLGMCLLAPSGEAREQETVLERR